MKFVPPALATLVDTVPTGPEWLHEVKYDGYRIEAVVHRGKCTLYSRNGLDWTQRLPAIATRCEEIGHDLILDGEIVATGSASGDFQRLQRRLDRPVTRGVNYVVFDLLAVGSRSIRKAPLIERRQGLLEILGGMRGTVRPGKTLPGEAATLLDRACTQGLEGVISKRIDSPYRSGRTLDWRKIKCERRQEFAIVGFTPPGGSRSGFGSLLLAVHEGDEWVYAGRVGSGFDEQGLARLLSRLERLERRQSPLGEVPAGIPRGTRWVRPELVAEVKFTEWTSEGRLRHPVFVALRSDKPASEIRRETPRRDS